MSLTSGLLGCSSLQPGLEKKEISIKGSWIKTLGPKNKTHRRFHSMKPLVLETLIIQGNGYSGVFAISRQSGKEVWSFPIKNGVQGADVSGDSVFVGGGDGYFYSLNLNSGQLNWKFAIKAQVLSAPTYDSGRVFVLSGNNTLYSLDAKTGKQNWLYRRAQTTSITVMGGSQPRVKGRRLYIGMSDGYLVSLDKTDGGVLWERPLSQKGRFIDIDSTPLIQDGKIYVSSYDGSLFCLNESDGQIKWQLNEGGASVPALQNGRLYYSTTLGEVLSIRAETGKVIWRYSVPGGGIATSPSYYRGHLIFGESNGPLRVLSAQSGLPQASYNTGRGIVGGLNVTTQGEVYFISNQGYLYATKVIRSSQNSRWF